MQWAELSKSKRLIQAEADAAVAMIKADAALKEAQDALNKYVEESRKRPCCATGNAHRFTKGFAHVVGPCEDWGLDGGFD